MRNVWLYWEDLPGQKRAPYLDLCLETIRLHSPSEPVLLDYKTAFDYVDLDAKRWEALRTPAFRSDYLRARLLYRYGGLWADVDTIAFPSLGTLLETLRDEEVVAFGAEVERIYPGLMAARAGAAALSTWMERQDETLDAGRSDYSALGQVLISEMTREVGTWPLARVAPVMWWEWRRFASRLESVRVVLASDPPAIVLWNSGMGNVFGSASREDLLEGKCLLSRLLRVSLGLSTVPDEVGIWDKARALNRVRFGYAGRVMETRLRGKNW